MSKKKTSQEEKDSKTNKPTFREKVLLSEQTKKFDPDATREGCIEDLRRVQGDNEFAFITMNFYRLHGKYSDDTWIPFFGTFLEFRRQAGLEHTRHQHKLQREIARHASHGHYRDYYEREVLPYHLKYEKDHKGDLLNIMVASDLHDLEMDQFAFSVFLDQCFRIQPSGRRTLKVIT